MLQSGRGTGKVGVAPKIFHRAMRALFISPPSIKTCLRPCSLMRYLVNIIVLDKCLQKQEFWHKWHPIVLVSKTFFLRLVTSHWLPKLLHRYATTCHNMSQHATTCYNMSQHATTCYNMLRLVTSHWLPKLLHSRPANLSSPKTMRLDGQMGVAQWIHSQATPTAGRSTTSIQKSSQH